MSNKTTKAALEDDENFHLSSARESNEDRDRFPTRIVRFSYERRLTRQRRSWLAEEVVQREGLPDID